MTTKVNHIPAGYHTATPYLIAKDAAAAVEFYKKAFGAIELERIADETGKIRHGEFKDRRFAVHDHRRTPGLPGMAKPALSRRLAGAYLPLRRERGCRVQTGDLQRGDGTAAGAGPVLRGPKRRSDRSVWPRLVYRNTHRRRLAGRDNEARSRASLTAWTTNHYSTYSINPKTRHRVPRKDELNNA